LAGFLKGGSLHFAGAAAYLSGALTALALAGLLLAQGCTVAAAAMAGNPAPDFTLTDIDGNTVRLRDFRGKVVFINFWTTWCPSCRAEMPEIEAFRQQHEGDDVVILGIDLGETAEEVRGYVESQGFGWTFLLDRDGTVAKAYGVKTIPASFFIDRKGIIRATVVGAMTRDGMEARLAKAME
jgi:peroxiredoxin